MRLKGLTWETKNFNPHSPCGERPDEANNILGAQQISIHTPHAGSDLLFMRMIRPRFRISIHTPHAGSDPYGDFKIEPRYLFQSTLPMRGATFRSIKAGV